MDRWSRFGVAEHRHPCGCPILSRFVRKGGPHGPRRNSGTRTLTVYARGSHPCTERKGGAPFVVVNSTGIKVDTRPSLSPISTKSKAPL